MGPLCSGRSEEGGIRSGLGQKKTRRGQLIETQEYQRHFGFSPLPCFPSAVDVLEGRLWVSNTH